MYEYDKTVMKFLWISAVHFATDLRAAPPVIVPAERPNRRGGLGGTGSGGSRTQATADCADGAFWPAALRRVAEAERSRAQCGDERVLRVERGNDRRRAAAMLSAAAKTASKPAGKSGRPPLLQNGSWHGS